MEEGQNTEETHQSLVTRSIDQLSSKSSSASSAALKARARAEAASMHASFAKKEAEMMVEEATLKAKMHILKKEKDAATATAEEAVFVAAMENAEIDSHHDIDLPLLPSNAAQRTSEYVLQHSCGASEHISMYTCSQPAVEKVERETKNPRIDNVEDTHLQIAPKDVNSQPTVNNTQYTPGNFPCVQKLIELFRSTCKSHLPATAYTAKAGP